MVSRASTLPGSAETSSEDDAALLKRLQRGDTAAMGVLYDRYAPHLLALAVRMLRSEREAEDLLHDLFLEAWQSVRQYDETKGTVRTWLFVRLRSRALDRLGRAEAVRTRPLEDAHESHDLGRWIPDAVSAIDGVAVRQGLERVDANIRQVLELTYFEGLTAQEVAARLGVPAGTVKSRLARGIAMLQELFSAEENTR